MKTPRLLLSLLTFALVSLPLLASFAAGTYTVTTSSNAMTVTNTSNTADTLTVSEPNATSIQFAAQNGTFNVNGASFPSPLTISLAGITSIILNSGNGGEMFNVQDFSKTNNFPSLTINGGTGNDTVNFNGTINFDFQQNLTVNLQSGTGAHGMDNINVTGATLVMPANNNIDLECSQSVSITGGAVVQTFDGNLTVMANQQTTAATTGKFSGVHLDGTGTKVQATRFGTVTVTGTGGDDSGGFQIGVDVENGAQIIGGAVSVNVTGTGGASLGSVNLGVAVEGAGSAILGNGKINVTGTAGAKGSGFGNGVAVLYGGKIGDLVHADTNIIGTGGGASANTNPGVDVGGAPPSGMPASTITSTRTLSITATAGPGTSAGLVLSDAASLGSPSLVGSFYPLEVDIMADGIALFDTSSITATEASGIRIRTLSAATNIDLGGASSSTTLGLSTAELGQMNAPSLTFSSGSSGGITISQPITRASATDLDLVPGTAGFLATAVGTGLDLMGGTLFFSGPFDLPISGKTPGTMFPQLHVKCPVSIGNGIVALNLASATYTGNPGDTFTIIKNDGANAIMGTFQNLAEGATMTWPPNPSLTATVTYQGGTGHDVVLTLQSTVNKAPTTTTVTSSMNPSDFGHAVAFTVTVAPSGSGSTGVPAGTVDLLDNGTQIATATLDATGKASFPVSNLALGSHPITARYGGDSNFAPSASTGTLTQTVLTADTVTTVTSSVNPSIVGQDVMFTATVSLAPGGTGSPTGSVLFDFGDGSPDVTISLSTGVAQVDHSFLGIGTFKITGTYSGDGNFNPSSNTGSLVQMVSAAGPGPNAIYSSFPDIASTIDCGSVLINGTPASRKLLISNTGTDPLEITAVQIDGGDSTDNYHRSISRPDGSQVTSFPEIIGPGSGLTVTITFTPTDLGVLTSNLRVGLINKGSAFYLLSGTGVRKLNLIEELSNLYFSILLAHNEHQPGSHSLVRAAAAGTQMATLVFDGSHSQSVTTDIPAYLGGGSITLHDFTGSVTVSALPIPGDAAHMALRVESGTMTAPSFRTPSGQDTGVNTLTFGSPDASGGTLQLSDGTYTAFAEATITNALIPAGVIVKGTYSGTYNAQTGQVTSNSNTTDILTANARSLNISTRLAVGTGDNVLIGGFIVTGSTNKNVIIRARGPSLGLTGALADPALVVVDQNNKIIASNDNWQTTVLGGLITADQVAAIQASGLAPGDNHESAVLVSLAPGSYTAIISGANNSTGIGLAEVYDLDTTATSKLANISTRGFVQTGDNVMIGGFIVGAGPASKVIVRARGPSLGLNGALPDPMLTIVNQSGTVVATNDNWQTDPGAAEIMKDNLAPGDPKEAATLQTLAPGNYTAIVSGTGGATGIGLVEVYNVQ